jgi:methyltransferase (TIGR00027 family)
VMPPIGRTQLLRGCRRSARKEALMTHSPVPAPDATAVFVALWRALHVAIDPPPHVLHDMVGLKLASPPPGWRQRSSMDPLKTRRVRASIVGRARFVDDLVEAEASGGVDQYLILGAGLDSFAQRRVAIASKMQLFEVDRPGPQAWKRQRLLQVGFGISEWLHLVPVDFEAGNDWSEEIMTAGFDFKRPAVVSALGLTMYLSREAIGELLRRVAATAPGSTLVMSFLRPPDGDDAEERALREAAQQRAREGGTPFVSAFAPDELAELACASGFREAKHVSAADLTALYFQGRSDGLLPLRSEELMVAKT